jgi:lipoate-protein ligase A
MILWCDGAHDVVTNMRRDDLLLAAAEAGASPVLRLFQFEPHGITLGRAQTAERELSLARCARDGVAWAVRPTGGRAIFHAQEWTYSLASPLTDPRWGGSLSDAYANVSSLIAAALRRMGVPVDLARANGEGRVARHDRSAVAPPCFASTARHEITLGGRKLVGSAQRRTALALLQQGSVLLGDGHLRLVDYLAIPEPRRTDARAALAEASAHAGGALGGQSLERWAEALESELPETHRYRAAEGEFLLAGPDRVELPDRRPSVSTRIGSV